MNDMENYLSDQVEKAVQNSNDLPDQFFRSQSLRDQNMAQQSQISSSEQIIRALEGKMNRLAHENRMLQARIDDLNDPFAPPTEEEKEAMAFNRWRMENKEFEKKTYISSFMFQALAYKELAIQMGMKEGLTPDQVAAMERDYMDRVLNDDNKTEHYTGHSNLDFNDAFFRSEHKSLLKKMNIPNRIEEWRAEKRKEIETKRKLEVTQSASLTKSSNSSSWDNFKSYLITAILLFLIFLLFV